MLSRTLALSFLVGLAFGDDHVSGKNTAFDGLGLNEDGLYNALTPPSSSYRQWEWGTLPEFCYKSAIPTAGLSDLIHCNPYDIEVYDLTYGDCGHTWTLCRCHNATWTLDETVDIIGRIPVKARQYTRSFASYASIAGSEATTWAYSLGLDTAYFDGPEAGGHRPTLVLHENAHTVDYGWNQQHGGSGWVSSESGWVDAINADTCVPDGYAKSNDIEDFAQVSVTGSYDKNVGPLSNYGNVDCMKNQLSFVESNVGETLVPGGTCDVTWQADSVVCMGPAAGCGNQGDQVAREATSAKFRKKAVGSVPVNKAIPIVDELHKLAPDAVGKRGYGIKRRD